MNRSGLLFTLILILLSPLIFTLPGSATGPFPFSPALESRIWVENNLLSLSDLRTLWHREQLEVPADRYLELEYYTRQQFTFYDGLYTLGFIHQAEGEYSLLGDSLQYRIDSYVDADTGREYELDIESRIQQVRGIFVREDLTTDLSADMSGYLQLNFFQGLSLEGRRYRGRIWPDDYKSEGSRVRYYSGAEAYYEDINFRALGWSVDLDLAQKLSGARILKLRAENMVSYMRWIDVYTRLTEEGLGLSYGQNYRTSFSPYVSLTAEGPVYGAGISYHRESFYPRLIRKFSIGQQVLAAGFYGPNLQLAWEGPGVGLEAYFSDLRPAKITGLGLNLKLQVLF